MKSYGLSPKTMVKFIILLLVIAFGLIGCGAQRGRFLTTGSQEAPLSPETGSIDIVDGYSTKAFKGTNAVPRHLLYVVIVCPGVQELGMSSGADYGEYITTLDHRWSTKTGVVAASVSWDRRTDTVEIGKQKFSRDKGNVFIVRCEPNKEVVGQQLTSLVPNAGFHQVLDHVRQQLPNDEFIGSLKLPD